VVIIAVLCTVYIAMMNQKTPQWGFLALPGSNAGFELQNVLSLLCGGARMDRQYI